MTSNGSVKTALTLVSKFTVIDGLATVLLGLLIFGNLLPSLPTWGFDYHVVGLPYGSKLTWVTNSLLLAVALFPLIRRVRGVHHTVYLYVAVCVMAIVVFRASLELHGFSLPPLAVVDQEQTGSVFYSVSIRIAVCVFIALYLLWSIERELGNLRAVSLIAFGIAATALVSGAYVVHLVG